MITVSRNPARWTVTLDRPDKANSLTAKMLSDLADTFDAARVNKVPVLVLTGQGKVFSAGADLNEVKEGTLATDPVWERASGALAAFPGLSLCALNGTLAGGAFGVALACDMRLCVPEAKFFYPVMRMGYLPQPSDSPRLTALVGPARAKHLLMSGERWDSAKAQSWGLVEEVLPLTEMMDRIDVLAGAVESVDYGHLAAIKRLWR